MMGLKFMRKLIIYIFVLLLLLRPFLLVAQPALPVSAVSAVLLLKEEQDKLFRQLNYLSVDSVIVYELSGFIKSETDSIYSFIISDNGLPIPEKEKAFRSLCYFMQELGKNIAQQQSEMYDIPDALESYNRILMALLYHKPFADVLKPLGRRRCQMLASAFSQYKEYFLLNDIAVYKSVASSPEVILRFLENKPGFQFTDSLLLDAAAYNPLKIIYYLNDVDAGLQDNIRNTKNIYLQQIASLSEDKNVTELLPFVTQLAEKRITTKEILEKRMEVVKYFQLLVNTLQESKQLKPPSFGFQNLLRNGIKEKSLSFYVNQINEQHGAADAIRFASVKDLRSEDLYYIITSCGKELYTSSYLGLYKRLMEHFKPQSADSLFSIVQYDNFRIFIRMAANYNMLTDFLSNMPGEKTAALLKRFIYEIESDLNSGLEKAMDIADSFTGLGAAPEISKMIQKEMQANLDRCQSARIYFGIRLYNVLLQVFDLVNQKDPSLKLQATLGNYEMLERNMLQNKKGEIIELVLFYGDDDGIASFNNFQKLFTNASKWKISENENWITIRSLSEQPIIIYANIPLDSKEGKDIKAQDSLIAFLQQQSAEPVILIHRGHSYHLDNTMKRLTSSVKLAILGSCGSSNSAISIANINPDAQIIVSKKIGSKSINDPIIDVINETLLDKKDLSWPKIWDKLAARFSKDEDTLNLFNEYIPPDKNVSLFVLKLFNFYKRPAYNSSSVYAGVL
jgi:hypothetical protein